MDLRGAIVLTVGVVLAALAHGGIYQAIPARGSQDVGPMYRINKFTGSVLYCQGQVCVKAERFDQ
jgi:hypothetical protein